MTPSDWSPVDRARAVKRTLVQGGCRLVSALRGHRGVPLKIVPGYWVNVHPVAYEDFRYWTKYEKSTVAALAKVWRPRICIVDIGAHHGAFSVCALRGGGHNIRLLSVEPSPQALAVLEAQKSIHRNEQWTLHPVALMDSEGETILETGWSNMLVPDNSFHPGSPAHQVTVATRTLDELCRSEHATPDLIKIDVEGLEGHVLDGATRTLEARPVIFLEWHRDMLQQQGIDPMAPLELLRRHDYRFEPYETPKAGALDYATLEQTATEPIVRLLCHPSLS